MLGQGSLRPARVRVGGPEPGAQNRAALFLKKGVAESDSCLLIHSLSVYQARTVDWEY